MSNEKTSYQQMMEKIAEEDKKRSANPQNIKVGDICMYPFYEDDSKNKSKCLIEVVDVKERKDMGEGFFFLVVKFLVVGKDDSGNGLFEYLKRTGKTMNVSPGYCRKAVSFENAEELLSCVVYDGIDLYSPSAEIYVFGYNDDGAIATYNISHAEAEELIQKSMEADDYWGAFLGVGGTIYDAFDENNPPSSTTNIEKCDELAQIKDWVPVTDYFCVDKPKPNSVEEVKNNE